MSPVDNTSTDRRPLNAVTVDVEDWYHAVLFGDRPASDRFYANTHKIMAAFADRGIRGTFFVLGLAAERAPQLVREIQAAGHEVQSHGYGHRVIQSLTPTEFRADLARSKKLLEDITGREICGYRAPAFSITRATLWALDTLVETGFRYDSSVFPLRTRRYGIDGAPPYPHVLRTPAGYELKEFPVASYRIAGRRIPVGGGGYFRLLPYFVLRRGVQQLNATGHAAIIYMHPYEFNPQEIAEVGHDVTWKLRLRSGLWRRYGRARVERMLGEFRFGRIQDVLDSVEEWPRHEHRAVSPAPESGPSAH